MSNTESRVPDIHSVAIPLLAKRPDEPQPGKVAPCPPVEDEDLLAEEIRAWDKASDEDFKSVMNVLEKG